MPTNITETSTFTATLQVPNDGEAYNSASLLSTFLQGVANRLRFLRNGLAEGAWAGRRMLYAPGDGTVRVGVVAGVVIGGVLLSKATETTLTLGTLPNNTWVYVYAYNNSGTLAFEVDAVNAPEAGLTFKSTDATRRFVGAFVTNGSAAPVAMRYVDGECLYRFSVMAVDATRVLNNGTSATWVDVSCAGFVPPHARHAILRMYALLSGASVAELRTKGDTTSSVAITAAASHTTVFPLETDSAQKVQYQISAGNLYIHAYGYRE